jgi:hypothetical protein
LIGKSSPVASIAPWKLRMREKDYGDAGAG